MLLCRQIPVIASSFKRNLACLFINRLASTHKDEEIDPNIPIKFSTSEARTYKATVSRVGTNESRLWYEPHVILGSLTAFLIYFCVLREENDIDKELQTSLYSRIEGLEEAQLKMSLKYNLDNGRDTEAIIKRLQEIEQEKQSNT